MTTFTLILQKNLTILLGRIAVMVHDFRDMCQGSNNQLNGRTAFSLRLLSKAGYQVLSVPHSEFSSIDKPLKRVQYLEAKMKSIK